MINKMNQKQFLKDYLKKRIVKSNRDYIFIQFSFIFAISAYLLNEKSRKALGNSGSSHFGNNLKLKIFLIICAYLITGVITYLIILRAKYFNNSVDKSIFRYLPIIAFLSLNFMPAFLQHFHNFKLVNYYYEIMQVSNKFPNFIDLRQTIGFITNPLVNNIGDEGLIYPTLILKLRFLKNFLEKEETLFLIAFLSTIFLVWIIFDISKNYNRSQLVILAVLVISPPFLLLVDRQNIDLIILIFLYISAKIFGKNFCSDVISLMLIFICTVLKIYPVFILAYLFFKRKSKWVRVKIGFVFIGIILLISQDSIKIWRFGIKDMSGTAGLPVLLSHFNGLPNSQLSFSFIFLFFLFTQLLITYWLFTPNIPFKYVSSSEGLLAVYGLIIFLVTMTISTNYPYRLTFLLFFVPKLMEFIYSPFLYTAGLFLIQSTFLSPRSTGILFNLYLYPFLIIGFIIVVDSIKKNNSWIRN
jgi:hypothetical protein